MASISPVLEIVAKDFGPELTANNVRCLAPEQKEMVVESPKLDKTKRRQRNGRKCRLSFYSIDEDYSCVHKDLFELVTAHHFEALVNNFNLLAITSIKNWMRKSEELSRVSTVQLKTCMLQTYRI